MIQYNRTPKILSRSFGTKFFLFLFLSSSLFFSSCDESSVVGLDVQPTDDLLNVSFQDTTSLVTKTIREDSLRTDEGILSTALVGKYIDPIFGEASASLYTQIALSTTISTFGTTPVCDSMVVWLAYDPTYYGKRERKPQTLNLLEVTEAIPTGVKYSNKVLATGTDRSGAYTFTPRPTDSVYVSGIKSSAQLRIPLGVSFGQSFLDNPANLASNSTLQTAMKGFYITTENTTTLNPGEGNILNFKMAASRMTLYYHYTGKTKITLLDSTIYTKYDFGFGGVARFSHFSHNYTTVDPDLNAQLSGTPPAQNDVIFLQSMSGVKTKIELPNLMHWIDSGAVSINKAELIIKADVNTTYQLDTFAAPASLVLLGIDDSGTNFLMLDGVEGSTYFGGTYNSATKEYRFNIARYVQNVLKGTYKNNGLNLLIIGSAVNANRVVIGGGKNTSASRMKLNITYTKLH